MNYRNRLIQAYRNTPWRMQLQIIGLFSASVVFIAIIAGVYLNVTSRAATIGREIQGIQATQQVLEREIEDQVTMLADLTSAKTMQKRAEDQGFVMVDPGEAAYIQVDGYPGKQIAQLAPPAHSYDSTGPQLPREFTISLIEWMRHTIYLISLQTGAQVEGAAP